MSESFFKWDQVRGVLRLAVPYAVLALFILVSFVTWPFGLPAKPFLVLMIIYYWSIYRPTLMPPWLCFAAGLIMDMIGGGPLGLNAMILVAVCWVVSSQRRFLMGQNYLTIWLVFGMVSGVAALLEWALFGLVSVTLMSLQHPLFSFILSLCFFPFMTLLLVNVHKLLPKYKAPFPGKVMR